ncbi:DUF167 domain-containing protein [Brevibacillus borstelensis]|uniref:DUF167 family protein n=1 Tax=Brevibacillus TaxID=55080 RepID=UPI00046A8E72|nr:DUF167 family protein [Brevibacillus borstelensis]KKX54084.1 hypothetical protein X546_17145 [Brevibacillus borstelensis cifa_chp40]MBE5398114.1 DUF167 domain-containing protein [Brevibacillus borstelensis]MCM3557752.1 DUF167 family protein [Brevibacillus borstelensis]NOU55690.1 DUF167 domain-containing protein [Brevibacillus borstelensis]
MKLTVRKADGPGWLMIAEMVENGLYKVVTERCGEDPPYATILQFLHRLPRLLDRICGVEALEIQPSRVVSAKRAARAASREMEAARRKQLPGKSFQIISQELEKAAEWKREVTELTLWVKPGKKRTAITGETLKGMLVVEVTGSPRDSQTHDELRALLKKRFHAYDNDIELVEGYASQRKLYRITHRR